MQIGVHHGLFLFGSVKIIESLPVLIEGAEGLLLEEETEAAKTS